MVRRLFGLRYLNMRLMVCLPRASIRVFNDCGPSSCVNARVSGMGEDRTRGPGPLVIALIAAVAGTVGTVAIYAVMKTLVLAYDFPISSVYAQRSTMVWGMSLPTGYLIGAKLRVLCNRTGALWPAALASFVAANVGIATGVILWQVVEDRIFKRFGTYPIYSQDTLIGLTILYLWVLAAIPLVLGTCLGFALSNLRRGTT